MHLLSLLSLSLVVPCAVLSTPLVYLDDIQAELNNTTPSLSKLACPRIDPYNAWANATNLKLASNSALATSNNISTFPTAYSVNPISSKNKRTGLEAQDCTEVTQNYLYGQFLRNYNLPRTHLLEPGYHRIYAFSFECNPSYAYIEVFGRRSIVTPDIKIEVARIQGGSGSVLFELDQPNEVRIRMDWGVYQQRTCEFALFSIDLL